MTDTVALRNAIVSKGLKYKYVAKEIGLSPYGLQRKIENDNEFKASEMDKLSTLLGLTAQQKEDIFFAN